MKILAFEGGFIMSILPRHYMNAVVSIGTRNGDQVKWFGTGFFIHKRVSETQVAPFLVTNRHVFKNRQNVIIRLIEHSSHNLKTVDVPLMKDGKPLYLSLIHIFRSQNSRHRTRCMGMSGSLSSVW